MNGTIPEDLPDVKGKRENSTNDLNNRTATFETFKGTSNSLKQIVSSLEIGA